MHKHAITNIKIHISYIFPHSVSPYALLSITKATIDSIVINRDVYMCIGFDRGGSSSF
jgi:hypothetical protein